MSGRLRRYYRITGEGERVVAEEATRLRAASEVVARRLHPAEAS